MRVVTIDAPRCQYPFRESIFARPAHVIHDLLTSVFENRFANTRCHVVKYLVPADLLPLSGATFSYSLQWMEYPIRIVDLIERRRSFRTVAAPRSRMLRIALKFSNLVRGFINISEQATRRFAIEAGRRREHVA